MQPLEEAGAVLVLRVLLVLPMYKLVKAELELFQVLQDQNNFMLVEVEVVAMLDHQTHRLAVMVV